MASGLEFGAASPAVQERILTVLVDSLGTAVAGRRVGACQKVIRAKYRSSRGHGVCSVVGERKCLDPESGAFVNGAITHALNYDALGRFGGHLGAIAFPAVLAAAEYRGGASGADLLDGVYTAVWVTESLAASGFGRHEGAMPSDRWLFGQVLSCFGAAAGAARMLGLKDKKLRSALGLALMQSGGSAQVMLGGDHEAKAIYAGFPNRDGLAAALLAAEDVGADIHALEGPAGLFRLFFNRDCTNAELLNPDQLDVHMKPWPASANAHAFIEAAGKLSASVHDMKETVERIVVTADEQLASWIEPLAERRYPSNLAAAGNSIPYSVAYTLAHGDFTLTALEPDQLTDPTINRLAAKIECEYERGLGRGGAVMVEAGGSSWKEFVGTPLGAPARPMTWEGVIHKVGQCLEWGRAATQPQELGKIVKQLPSSPTISSLSKCLRQMAGLTAHASEASGMEGI